MLYMVIGHYRGNDPLFFAAALTFLIALAHSILGERLLLTRLLPSDSFRQFFGSRSWLASRTLRFAWHLTTVAWLGFAALLVLLADGGTPSRAALSRIIAVTFGATAAIIGVASRGRHFAWIVFMIIAMLIWVSA